MSDNNLAVFAIAQKHAAAVYKFREYKIDSWDFKIELHEIKEEAQRLGVPYVIPDNFMDLVRDDEQYTTYEDSSSYYSEEHSY